MRTFGISVPLFDKAKDPADGGGSGGGEQPKGFTEDQQAELGKLVNAAVTSQLKRAVGPAVAEGLKGINWGEALKLDDVLDAKLSKILEDDGGESGGKGAAQQPAKPDPKIAALEAQLAEMKKQQADAAAALERANQAGREKDAKAALRAALSKDVLPDRLEAAVELLFDARKKVSFDESGTPLFTVRRSQFGIEEDTPMPLADGVKHWLKSDDAKMWLPVPGSQGAAASGGRGPQRASQLGPDGLPAYDKPATTDAERVRRAEEREQAYRAKFPHLT